MLTLPHDLIHIIYSNLDGRSRARLRISTRHCLTVLTALPNSPNVKQTERKLHLAENYIERNKKDLISKEQALPITIRHFLFIEATQNQSRYASHLLTSAGLDAEISAPSCWTTLISHIRSQKSLINMQLQLLPTIEPYAMVNHICDSLIECGNQQAIEFCFKHSSFSQQLKDWLVDHAMTCAFKAVTYENEVALTALIQELAKTDATKMSCVREYMHNSFRIMLFADSTKRLSMIFKHFGKPTAEMVETLLQMAEERLDVEVTDMMLQVHMAYRKS